MSLFESDGFRLFAVSALVMGLSHTIAKERLFLPLRQALGGIQTWSGYLISCPYCVSHWLALLLVPLTGVYAVRTVWDLGPVTPFLDWLLSSILVAVFAAFLRVGFYFVDESQGLQRRRKKVVEEEATILETRLESGEIRPPLH